MKKSLIALAVLAASGAAMAQSSVTLYGRLDASVGRTTTETTGSAKVSQTVIDQSNLNTTFWGLKGTEDLGGGLTANFKLESGFALDTGVGNTGLFERTATVGLAGGFGAVNLGRQYTAYDTLRGATNNVYDSNMATTSGTKGVWRTGIADYTNRISNSVRYDSPVFSGISGSVAYGFGEDKTATVDASESISLHVKYVAGPLLVGYAYQEEQAQTFTTVAPIVANGTVTNKYNLLGASYDFGVAKLTGSYNQAKSGTFKDKEYQVGVSMPFGAFAVAAGYSKSESEGQVGGDREGDGYTLVGTYDLSKRTTLYVGYKNIDVQTSATASKEDSTFAAGVRHTF
ncbi:porin [Rhodoferax sp.]|uniref:porin n=1 Tax=Rhodoferax sp. TaxID=50421 RepID=UPI0027318E5F|nr:porin [Rhodoferax sp.]MDP2443003.1 porin [Rhodoferax sp.]MDZ4206528.1 porin [Rhodoferax sp.]